MQTLQFPGDIAYRADPLSAGIASSRDEQVPGDQNDPCCKYDFNWLCVSRALCERATRSPEATNRLYCGQPRALCSSYCCRRVFFYFSDSYLLHAQCLSLKFIPPKEIPPESFTVVSTRSLRKVYDTSVTRGRLGEWPQDFTKLCRSTTWPSM